MLLCMLLSERKVDERELGDRELGDRKVGDWLSIFLGRSKYK